MTFNTEHKLQATTLITQYQKLHVVSLAVIPVSNDVYHASLLFILTIKSALLGNKPVFLLRACTGESATERQPPAM
jgi:hypothetical protein